MKASKIIQKKTYTIANPSPLSTKIEALSFIKKKIDDSKEVSISQVANHLKIPKPDADSIVKELANAGYVRIGRAQKKNNLYGSRIVGSNRISTHRCKDATRFLKGSVSEDAETSEESDSE